MKIKIFIKNESEHIQIGEIFLTQFIPRIGEIITFKTKTKGRNDIRIDDMLWFIQEDLIHITGHEV